MEAIRGDRARDTGYERVIACNKPPYLSFSVNSLTNESSPSFSFNARAKASASPREGNRPTDTQYHVPLLGIEASATKPL